jgi:hypothetical protein
MSFAKEKAEELFDKYYQLTKTLDENNNWYGIFSMKKLAKQCALIAVDEIIFNIDATIFYHKDSNALPLNKEYWQEVKKEIEKL